MLGGDRGITASAVLAMEGRKIRPEMRGRILRILSHYEAGLLRNMDCTGCVWLDGGGCRNPKDCQRDELVDRYQAKEGTHEGCELRTGDYADHGDDGG